MVNSVKRELARAKIRSWRDMRSGWLVVESDQIAIYRNKLIGGPQKLTQFNTDRLAGIELDEVKNSLRVIFHVPGEEPKDELFVLQGKTQTDTVISTLKDLLNELKARKKQEAEEAERLEKEYQEQLKLTRERFASEIWETSEILWLICKSDYAMVRAVIEANWDEARQQYSRIWQESDRLKQLSQIEITGALENLDGAVTSQNGQEIIQKAGDLIQQLSHRLLHYETNWPKWQNDQEMLAAVSPNYGHLSYFLLFSTVYFEMLLAAQIEDWASVNSTFPLIRSCSTILQSCFNLLFNGSLAATNSAIAKRNLTLLLDAARQIESAVGSVFQARPFKFETPSNQPKE